MMLVTRRRWLLSPTLLAGWKAATAAPFRIQVIAHRGAHTHAPENSLEACRATVELGCDFAELDVRTTADGTLVLNHDKLPEGARSADYAHFDDALAILARSSRSRTGVYVDLKDAPVPKVVALLRKHRMEKRAVIYSGRLERLDQFPPPIRIMPEAVSESVLRQHLARWPGKRLRVAAFDHRDFTDPVIAIAKAAKLDIFVDRLGPADNPESWEDAIRRGATGIQTDKPAELLNYLGKTRPSRRRGRQT